MYIAIFVLTFIMSAVICHFVAKSKGKRPVFWGVMGGVFGSLAIPFVFLLK
ncbi:hypothetical protein MNBD_GAMMA07-681 [hydrothermal vent metagenome]|uniref:Uncharacterized protein n=1 Tax=hydrothermal vent metagenome TaxID=652676 RepID=A0A3B0X305_9ZZZZ